MMRRGSTEGRKVDEFMVNDKRAVLRMDFHRRFKLEVDGLVIEGTDPQKLEREAELILSGYDKLAWEKVAVLHAELESGFELNFHRYFMAKRGKRLLFREWTVDGKAESSWGKQDSFDKVEGEPGALADPRITVLHRIMPYTPELWQALRRLNQSVELFLDAARKRIQNELERGESDLAHWIVEAAEANPAWLFTGKAADK